MAEFTLQGFEKAARDVLSAEIDSIAEEEIKRALERIDGRIREKLGALSLSLLNRYDVQMNNDTLVITVRNETSR